MSARQESTWWIRTAESDLRGARRLAETGVFHLAAFHAQQAAEKALKAVLTARGKTHRTHACTALFRRLDELGVDVPEELVGAGRRLDLHYIQSRYPNGLGGDPTDYYDDAIAREAIELAESILQFSRTEVPS